MKHLDLFSGIGGFALAARNVGWETIAFCESEPFCQAVLRKHWPGVPIHNDVRKLQADAVGHVDIITGGYPCQPFSLAGQRRGKADDRHLWPEFARLIRALRPRWAVGENVAGHITMGLDDVFTDLEGLGYTWEAFVIPACAVDARHKRDRVWITAHTSSHKLREQPIRQPRSDDQAEPRDYGAAQPLADTTGRSRRVAEPPPLSANREIRIPQPDESRNGPRDGPSRLDFWKAEPRVGRVADGIPNRVDRLRALGNAIVPQVAEEIFRAINLVS